MKLYALFFVLVLGHHYLIAQQTVPNYPTQIRISGKVSQKQMYMIDSITISAKKINDWEVHTVESYEYNDWGAPVQLNSYAVNDSGDRVLNYVDLFSYNDFGQLNKCQQFQKSSSSLNLYKTVLYQSSWLNYVTFRSYEIDGFSPSISWYRYAFNQNNQVQAKSTFYQEKLVAIDSIFYPTADVKLTNSYRVNLEDDSDIKLRKQMQETFRNGNLVQIKNTFSGTTMYGDYYEVSDSIRFIRDAKDNMRMEIGLNESDDMEFEVRSECYDFRYNDAVAANEMLISSFLFPKKGKGYFTHQLLSYTNKQVDHSMNGGCYLINKINFHYSIHWVNVEEKGNEALFNLYPNPSNGVFNLVLDAIEYPAQLMVYSTLGQVVFTSTLNGLAEPINADRLLNGTYIYEVQGRKQTYRGKFQILK